MQSKFKAGDKILAPVTIERVVFDAEGVFYQLSPDWWEVSEEELLCAAEYREIIGPKKTPEKEKAKPVTDEESELKALAKELATEAEK